MSNREEHLQMSKDRALEYCDRGDLPGAMSSMASDLMKHPELKDHIAISLMMQMSMIGALSTAEKMSGFINGFN